MDTNDYLAASAMLEEMILADSENKNYWTWQANAFLSQKETGTAAANLEVIKRLGKATATSLGLLGDIYLNDGLNELALENYMIAAEMEDLSPQRLLRTAEGLIRRQLWDEGSTYLDKTVTRIDELSPSDQMTFRNLQARTALGNGDIEKASDILETIVAEDPMNGQALLTLANLKREQELFEDAAFNYEQAAKMDATKIDAMVEHARMLVTMRDYNAAATILQRVVVLEPSPRLENYLERVQSAARAASGRI
jgi:tetratricopeptide (TPR) repeat protein